MKHDSWNVITGNTARRPALAFDHSITLTVTPQIHLERIKARMLLLLGSMLGSCLNRQGEGSVQKWACTGASNSCGVTSLWRGALRNCWRSIYGHILHFQPPTVLLCVFQVHMKRYWTASLSSHLLLWTFQLCLTTETAFRLWIFPGIAGTPDQICETSSNLLAAGCVGQAAPHQQLRFHLVL